MCLNLDDCAALLASIFRYLGHFNLHLLIFNDCNSLPRTITVNPVIERLSLDKYVAINIVVEVGGLDWVRDERTFCESGRHSRAAEYGLRIACLPW